MASAGRVPAAFEVAYCECIARVCHSCANQGMSGEPFYGLSLALGILQSVAPVCSSGLRLRTMTSSKQGRLAHRIMHLHQRIMADFHLNKRGAGTLDECLKPELN